MRKLAILTFQTLDGVMQAPGAPEEDTSSSFKQGGWAAPYFNDVMKQVLQEAMAQPYEMLLGRNTYESFASVWPHVKDDNPMAPVAKIMNTSTKYVATSTPIQPEWQNTKILTGDVISEISKLKEQDGLLLQVHGSWQLIQALLKQGLIDEFRIWTFPVVVGMGKRLFADGTVPTNFKLTKSEASPCGVFMNWYEPTGRLPHNIAIQV